jgi:hypothetical protein
VFPAHPLAGHRAGHNEDPGQRRSRKTRLIPLAVLLVISGTAVASDGDAPKEAPAKFEITTKRADDNVKARGEQGRTVLAVKSPFGISQAVIERQEATWPQAVVLRLYFKGLSHLRASNGTTTLNAVASIQDG